MMIVVNISDTKNDPVQSRKSMQTFNRVTLPLDQHLGAISLYVVWYSTLSRSPASGVLPQRPEKDEHSVYRARRPS